jgi:hypothetical protein
MYIGSDGRPWWIGLGAQHALLPTLDDLELHRDSHI